MPSTKTSPKKRRTPSRMKRLPKGTNGGIELLLVQTVEHLGKQGDVVEVRPGYATNYLLPQGLAVIASDHHKRMIEKHRARLTEIQKKRLVGLQALANQISAQSLTIEANANDEGHLYGSVGAPEIVLGLKKLNIAIGTDQVRLEGLLKELGLYTVKIHLAQDVDAELKVWVVPTVSEETSAS